ncbi:MAG: serine hydrolase [Cyanobacteria bacterium J06597_16]
MVQISLSTSTTFEGNQNALVEDQGTTLTVRFDLDEPAPSSGLRVFLDSELPQILNRLDFAGVVQNRTFENIQLLPLPQRTNDRSGLAITIAPGADFATFSIDVDNADEFDPPQLPFDGLVEAEFSLLRADQIPAEHQDEISDISDYTVDSNAVSSTVLFADTVDQLPGGAPEPPTQETPEPPAQETPEPPTQETPEPPTQETPEPPTQETLLPDRVVNALESALDNNLPSEVPGAAVAILTPEGEWFGASGLSDIENDVPLQPNDRFEAGSITKTFVATTILQLVEENALSLDDTLTTWLPTELTDLVPNASAITVEQILNHTSGIADYVDPLTNQALSNPALFLNEWTTDQLVGFLDGVEPFFDPGTDWRYSNTNYILAGEVIEAVTGNSYGAEIRDRIIEPLNLENTFVFGEEEIPGGYINSYWDFDGDGNLDNLNVVDLSWTGAAGSVISNAEDLADFFDGLLVDGALLEAETLEEMLDTIPVNSPNYDEYGLGIGTLESRNRFWYVHRGQTLGFRSNLWYSPLEEITYVELLNGRSSSNLVSDLLPTYRRTIQPPTPDPITYEFEWTGQIAEFSVEGNFTYDASAPIEDGIIREENLTDFDIAFFDPSGNLLQTYEDNHLTFDAFNFAFDTETKQVLTDGLFDGPEGINVGEKTAVGEGFTGLNLWSKSKETSSALIHLDDWSRELGFPVGYSTHEDISFLTKTTAELIETGKVGETYLDDIQDTLGELGSPIVVSPPENDAGSFVATSGTTSLFLDFSLFESAGLTIQDATPTATPFSHQFQLGFEIDNSDFTFQGRPFTPESGTLEHIGDIRFLVGGDVDLTIGDFSVGFDENRVSDTASGFFVADTLEDGLGIDILFDVSAPDRLLVKNEALTLADADLLLAPELAEILGLNDAVGTDVGDVRIDADLAASTVPPTTPPTTPPTDGSPNEISGSDADDLLIGTNSPDIIEAFGGDDTVAGSGGDDQILGGDGDDVLRGDGNSTQAGVGGNDIIFGGSGNDRVGGKAGNDIISGDAGDDFIWGGDGDDIIMGVTGNDTLVGDNFASGSGSDLFVFGSGDGTDTVLDFEVGIDRIGIVTGEFTFAEVTLTQDGTNTLLGISSTGETLAILNNVQASALGESDFVTVPDVSNPDEALALI